MNYKRTAVVDLDGTLAQYDGWKGPDYIGDPMPNARDAMMELREWGWRIIVFTTRDTEDVVLTWLEKHDIPHDGVNTTSHNPPGCSNKPIGQVYFDDLDAHTVGRKYNWHRAMRRVRRLYQPPLNPDIEDAQIWSDWWRGLW